MQMLCVQDTRTALLFLYTRLAERSEPATGLQDGQPDRQPRDTGGRAAQRHFSMLPLAALDGDTRHSRCCEPFRTDFTIQRPSRVFGNVTVRWHPGRASTSLLISPHLRKASKQSEAIRTPRPCLVAERSYILVLFVLVTLARDVIGNEPVSMFGQVDG